VLLSGLVVSVGNLLARTTAYDESLWMSIRHNSVWLSVAMGVSVFAAGMTKTQWGRGVQCIVVLAVACLSALQATSGDLTSIVYFGLAILIGSIYGFLETRRRLKLTLLGILYGSFMAIGTAQNERAVTLAVILNLVGAAAVAYLFIVVTVARVKEMEDRQSELERLVSERTRSLQDEVSLRAAAEESMREVAEQNKTLAGDREVLLRELHHRTKNDLQTVLSLLSLLLQKRRIPELPEVLRPTQDRIRAIALVHEQLDNSERFDAINLNEYLGRLLRHLQISRGQHGVRVEADIDAEASINLESATHTGLLVHELVLCSFRNGFREGDTGVISVSAKVADGDVLITVADDGRILPEHINPTTPDEDELAIVPGLVRRLQCAFSLDREPHTRWHVVIPFDVVRPPAAPAAVGQV
jgi:two-component sensor histidine kinase